MTSLFIGVITPTGNPRNSNLLKTLENFTTKPVVEGISISELPVIESTSLTKSEIACKISHSMMYKKAFTAFEWALILEDDVEVNIEELLRVWKILENSSLPGPQIVSCYLGKWSVVRKSKEVEGALSCLYPPDGALCYFINKKAMEIALKGIDYVRPADWPLWSSQVGFLIFPGIAQELRGTLSLIDPLESRMAKSRNFGTKIKEFIGVSYFQELGFNLRALRALGFWVYRQRIIWYLPKFFKGERSSKFS